MKNKEKKVLYDKLKNFSLDNPEASFSFTDRLARENGWTKEYANRVVDEYKKFVYMSMISGKSLTPSEEVDQAWHLHLIYSQSYWLDMCQDLLGGFQLHHGPTKGGLVEKKRYNTQYEDTLEYYKKTFNEEPPTDIWPDLDTRFNKINFRRVSVDDNIILSKDKVKKYLTRTAISLGVLIGSLFLLSSESTEKLSLGEIFLWVVGFAFLIFIVRGLYRYNTRNTRYESRNTYSSKYGSTYTSSSSASSKTKNKDKDSSSNSDSGCSVASSFFGCGSSGCSSGSLGCGSSGCGSSGCGGGGCGGCGS